MAEQAGLDLVMVAANVQPPVCRIVDHGKYKYETEKREKEGKAKRFKQDVKGIKFRPGTAIGDLNNYLKRAEKWLAEGHKVRFVVQHRARELTHPEIAKAKLQWFLDQLGTTALVEKSASLDGNLMTMVIYPAKKPPTQGSKDVKVENVQDSSETV